MSYNGIGLSTARGSGTNGYVQKSLSHIKHKPVKYKDAVHYSSAPAATIKPANKDILMHERLRVVEIKCLEMEDLLLEQGLDADDIEEQVDALRKNLLTTLDETIANENLLKVSNTHQLAEQKEKDNAKFGKALGIKDGYTPGSSFSAERQEQRKREMEEEREQKRIQYEERRAERQERDRKYREEKELQRKKYEEEKEIRRAEREKRYLEEEEERRLRKESRRDRSPDDRRRSRSPTNRRSSSRRDRSPGERRGRSRSPVDRRPTRKERTPSPSQLKETADDSTVATTRKRRRFASKSKSKSPVKDSSLPLRRSVSVSPPRRRAATPSSE